MIGDLCSTANVPALTLCRPSSTARLPSSAAVTSGDSRHDVSPDNVVIRCCSRSRDVMSCMMTTTKTVTSVSWRGQPVSTSTPSWELEDITAANFYCLLTVTDMKTDKWYEHTMRMCTKVWSPTTNISVPPRNRLMIVLWCAFGLLVSDAI